MQSREGRHGRYHMGMLFAKSEGRPSRRPRDPAAEIGGKGTTRFRISFVGGKDNKTCYFQRQQIELRNDLVYRRHTSGLLPLVIPPLLKSDFFTFGPLRNFRRAFGRGLHSVSGSASHLRARLVSQYQVICRMLRTMSAIHQTSASTQRTVTEH